MKPLELVGTLPGQGVATLLRFQRLHFFWGVDMTRIQELYRIIDLNEQAIELYRKELKSLDNEIRRREGKIEDAIKELDELFRI